MRAWLKRKPRPRVGCDHSKGSDAAEVVEDGQGNEVMQHFRCVQCKIITDTVDLRDGAD